MSHATSKQTHELLTNPNYLEILNALHYEDLTVSELSLMLKQPSKSISNRLAHLQSEGLVKAHTIDAQLTYHLAAKPQLIQLSSILYELWSEALAKTQSQALSTVTL